MINSITDLVDEIFVIAARELTATLPPDASRTCTAGLDNARVRVDSLLKELRTEDEPDREREVEPDRDETPEAQREYDPDAEVPTRAPDVEVDPS